MQWYFPHMKVTWYKLRCVLHIFAVLGPNLNRFPMVVVAATSPNVDPVSHYCIVIDVGRRQQQQQQDCNYECNQIYFLTRSPFRQSADDDDDAGDEADHDHAQRDDHRDPEINLQKNKLLLGLLIKRHFKWGGPGNVGLWAQPWAPTLFGCMVSGKVCLRPCMWP